MKDIIKTIVDIFINFRNFDIYFEIILASLILMFILRSMTRLKPLVVKWITVWFGILAQFAWINLNLSIQDICRQIIIGMLSGGLGIMGYSILKEYGLIQRLINKIDNGKAIKKEDNEKFCA